MKPSIKSNFKGWHEVAKNLRQINKGVLVEELNKQWLNEGQRRSIEAIAKNIPQNGMILADEVGMGKTRIAVALAKAVTQANGRVAVLIPAGLGYQWKEEFRTGRLEAAGPLRSLGSFFDEWPESGWFNESVLLVSHLFSNWQLKESSKSWRFGLLPEMYACLRNEKQRLPRNYSDWSSEFIDDDIKEIAHKIVAAIPKDKSNPARKRLATLSELSWSEELFEASSYTSINDEGLRNQLKSCVGLGLGIFDLVIIDEAHKNRGDKTGLSKLLDHIIVRNTDHRILGLTATPVELELSDWISSLKRAGVNIDENINIINQYADAVEKVKVSWKFSEDNIAHFKSASKKFEGLLKKYIIRRDKREDKAVEVFKQKTFLNEYQYRHEKELSIDPINSDFPDSWKKIICAAESLSISTIKKDDSLSKRIRLTLASGQGVNELIDNILFELNDDKEENVTTNDSEIVNETLSKSYLRKRDERVSFWKKTILDSVGQTKQNLFYHPSILATVKCIEEEYTKFDDKVLVFGKYTKPMEALVALINAREMIRRLDRGQFWSQAKIRRSEEAVVKAALNQLAETLDKKWTINKIKKALKLGERKRDSSRNKFRNSFLKNLRQGIPDPVGMKKTLPVRMLEYLEKQSDSNVKEHREFFINLTHACHEIYYGSGLLITQKIDPVLLWEKYEELVIAFSDSDEDQEEIQNEFGYGTEQIIVEQMNVRLQEEFGTQTGRFARFMYGQTSQHSRRIMQSAFNRKDSFPHILVAQSKVGREGLNLHRACKVVIMIHPEWNPSVVEQQIGRVDRLGSLWSEMVTSFSPETEKIPRIEIRPVIFKNTYDEQNWNVLMSRWDDLRAQLHGIIISERSSQDTDEDEKLKIKDLNDSAPKFYP